MPINEGIISVHGNLCKTESSGQLFRLMTGHKGGRVVHCVASDKTLDVLCTDHGQYLFLSVLNREAEAQKINVDGYTVDTNDEIIMKECLFECNEYTIRKGNSSTVEKNAISFMILKNNLDNRYFQL